MTARLAETVRRAGYRVVTLGVVSGALLFLAWQIISRTMAVVYETTDPEQALNWYPHQATALLVLAERRGISDLGKAPGPADLAQARALAEQALRSDPLAPSALTDLGRIAEGEGFAPRAAALMKLAGDRTLRDASAQGWLVSYALSRGDFAAALSHLDAILRTHPETRDQVLPLLAAFISDPRVRPLLVHLLENAPPWRAWFLSAAPPRVVDRAGLGKFYAEMQAGTRPASQEEIQPYLDRLVNDGLFGEAYAAWIVTLPPERRADSAILYNGAFRYPLSGSEFDWKIVQSLGADVKIVRSSAAELRTLRVEFSGARVEFHNVSHLLALLPGTYRLTGEVEAESLHTQRGLWWRVFCSGRSDPSLGQTDLVAGSMPWRPFVLSFVVPAKACRAQVLQLELPARIAVEKTITGVVSYRNLAIMRSGVEVRGEGP